MTKVTVTRVDEPMNIVALVPKLSSIHLGEFFLTFMDDNNVEVHIATRLIEMVTFEDIDNE